MNRVILNRAASLAAALLALLAQPAAALQEADVLFSAFAPTGDFVLELGGEEIQQAEIYLSQRAAAYLILAPEVASAVLISLRDRSVSTVEMSALIRRDDETIDLLADTELGHQGAFEIQNTTVVFEVDGKMAALKPRPPLLGGHTAEQLLSHKPELRQLAAEYAPAPEDLGALRAEDRSVRVRVFHGTWCPACDRLLPRVIGLAALLQGSNVRFEYYGLPQPMSGDSIVEREGIHAVPTGLVFVNGTEVGRLTGGDLNRPEAGLLRTVSGVD